MTGDDSKGGSRGQMRVKEVYTYPIKSIRGISLPSMSATYKGFPYDRHFMLYSVSKNQNMHIAYFTEMCLFTTQFNDNAAPTKLLVSYAKDYAFARPEVKIDDGRDSLEIDLAPDTQVLAPFEISMHSSSVVAYDMGKQVNDWFSLRFGHEVKLLYIGSSSRKVLGNVSPTVAGQQRDGLRTGSASAEAKSAGSWLGSIASTANSLLTSVMGKQYEGEDHGISFADVAPYLVISSTSWENAQRRLDGTGEVLDISKFRPNIIVEGADEEWEEDFWAELVVGDQNAKFVLTQNCARCNSVNVDYETGQVGKGEAGKILKKLNSDRRVDPGLKWSPVFGRYGFLAKLGPGEEAIDIAVGDEVQVARRNTDRTEFEWPNLSTNNK